MCDSAVKVISIAQMVVGATVSTVRAVEGLCRGHLVEQCLESVVAGDEFSNCFPNVLGLGLHIGSRSCEDHGQGRRWAVLGWQLVKLCTLTAITDYVWNRSGLGQGPGAMRAGSGDEWC